MARTWMDLARAPRGGRQETVIPFFNQFWGVNTTLPSNMLNDNEAVSCLNLKLNDQGKLVTREGLKKYIGADSLKYNTLEAFVGAVIKDSKLMRSDLCLACFGEPVMQ